jgi:hypothetical protein
VFNCIRLFIILNSEFITLPVIWTRAIANWRNNRFIFIGVYLTNFILLRQFPAMRVGSLVFDDYQLGFRIMAISYANNDCFLRS